MKVIAASKQVIHRLLRRAFAVFLLGLSTTAAGQDSGVLLGFRFWDDSPRYASLWIYSIGTQARVIEVPGLLVPRKSGFWRVGNYYTHITGEEIESPLGTTITDDTFEEHLWALPAGQRPKVNLGRREVMEKKFEDGTCVGIFREIHFANEAYVAVEKNAGYECGVHPDGDTELEVFSLDNLDGKRLAMSELFGTVGGAAFEKGLIEGTKQNPCGDAAQTDEKNWNLTRSRGHWIAQGWADTYRICGYGFNFEIPMALPKSWVGYDLLPFDWDVLARQIPKLSDAFSSPAKNLLVAVTNKEFLVFRPHGNSLDAPILQSGSMGVLTPDNPYGEGIVMAQWAVGKSVSRWTEQIEAIRKMDISVEVTPSK